MTEEEALDELVDFWKKVNFDNDCFIHKEDKQFFEKWKEKIKSYDGEEILSNKNSSYSIGKTVYTKLVPEHYVGSLTEAKVYCVLSNPGVSKEDFANDKDPKFKKAKIDGLKQKKQDYPFYMLNPDFKDYEGPKYWGDKLKNYIQMFKQVNNLTSDEEAEKRISKLVTNLELFPYHSKSFDYPDTFIHELPSCTHMINFIKYNLIPRAKKKEILLLFPRKVKFWKKELKGLYEDCKNILFYPSSSGFDNGLYTILDDEIVKINTALKTFSKIH